MNRNKQELLKAFKTIPPIMLFELSMPDMKIIDEIPGELPDEVINVLVDYVLRNYEMKFPRGIVLKIGSHWNRLGLKTAEEAMEQAIKEYQKNKKVETNHILLNNKSFNQLNEIMRMFGYSSEKETIEQCIQSVYNSFVRGEAVKQ